MNTKMITMVALLLALPSCTPAAQSSALIGVGVGACGAGQGASAAGQSWGDVLSSVGCWLADWAAEREDRRREAERSAAATSSPAAELDAIDQAAIQAAEAQARFIADPCEATATALREAYQTCLLVAPELGKGR